MAVIVQPQVFDITLLQGTILCLNGVLVMGALLCYYYALEHDEATYVVPFYQTIPIFAYVLGFLILKETIGLGQIYASLIIILGALILSFDLAGAGFRFKTKVVVLMLTASFLYGATSVLFKLVALDVGFWPATFWDYVGRFVLGVVLFLAIPSFRTQFFLLLRENKVTILAFTSVSEILFIVGESLVAYATLFAPVALVLLVNAFQPIVVLALGLVLTLLLPRLVSESLTRRQLVQKVIGVLLVVLGTYFVGVVQ